MLFLEGAISENPWGGITFARIKAQSHSDMVELVHAISQRIARYLEKQGSPITANNSRAPPVEALEQTAMVDDFIIQKDLDFGA